MRETYVKAGLVALLLALLPSVAGAAGLGRITVLSSIGQLLIAEVELVAVTPQELASLNARLALPDAYRQANLQYNVALTGARVTIEKRPSGQSYLKIASTRAVTEPFIDLLVEITWASGRLSREYTALLDPPGLPPLPATPTISAAPEAVRPPAAAPEPAPALPPAPTPMIDPAPAAAAAPALEPQPPVAVEPPAGPAPVVAAPVTPAPTVATPMATSNEYGPIERGETLGKIARSVKSEDVTLEQMLVALYRSNSEAFIRNNLNLVRAGKVLRVPDRDEVAAISRGEALQEYRTHVAEWNAYRQTLADAAVSVPAQKGTTVSGKITTRVDEKAGGAPARDVVRLSKGEPAGAAPGKGKPGSTAERIRALEEEAIARERALAEAQSRITQLEKTIQDMKKLAELRSPGLAAAQQQAQQKAAPAPVAKPEAVAVAKPAPQPVPARPEVVAVAKPEPAPTPTPKPQSAPVAQPKPQPAPAAQPRPKPAAMPPMQEPELMDQIMAAASDPLYLGAGGAVVLGGLAFWMVRRRRAGAGRSDSPPIAPRLGMAAAAAAGAAAVTGDTAADRTVQTTASAPSGEDVDPLQEAEVYIQYGRDGQAEEILKEALSRNPNRADVQLKLLEVYAGRKDRDAFGQVAANLNKLTGGAGPQWTKAAAMGFALDPSNALYEAGRDLTTTMIRPTGPTASGIDLDLGGAADTGLPRVSTDIMLDAGAVQAATVVLDTSILGSAAAGAGQKSPPPAPMPDFTLEVPAAGTSSLPDVDLGSVDSARDTNVVDFQIDLPKVEEPVTVVGSAPPAASEDAGLDFKIEGLDLKLDADPKTLPAVGEKDGHWYDVQTKFDLAKAYQEMGDRDGAKEILQEVIKEGDVEQQGQARKLMDSLG